MPDTVVYRRDDGRVTRVQYGALGLHEKISHEMQMVLERLKAFEPDIEQELKNRLHKKEEKQFQASLKELRKYLKFWPCPQCGHENPFSDIELQEGLRRAGRRDPRAGTVEYELGEPKERGAVPELITKTVFWWQDPTSKTYHCEECLQVYSIVLRTPFPIFSPWKKSPNPKVLPYFVIREHGGLLGEGEALTRPSRASVRLLKQMVKRYRDKSDLESQRRLSVAVNELQIRGLKP